MSYKIAATSSDGKTIDLHFGEVKSVRIYSVNEKNGSFIFDEERKILFSDKIEKEKEETGCSCGRYFVEQISSVVNDCKYLLVAKIGNRPYRFLQENNVNCIEAPFPIEEAIDRVNTYYVAHRERESHIF